MWTACVASLFFLSIALFRSGSPSDVRLPPTIVTGPKKHSYYRPDETFTLECKANGFPEVIYEWTKNGAYFNINGGNVKHEVDGTIQISQASASDGGFYQCIARNQYGAALSNTSFKEMAVLVNTAVSQVLTKTVNEGDPFCVEAHPTKSVPKAKLSWQKANDPADKAPERIHLSKRLQIAENGDLCFAFAKGEDDLGGKIYKITQFNGDLDLATGGSYTRVTVNRVAGGGKKFSPSLSFSSDPQTVVVEGRDVTLSCFFSGNPEPILGWIPKSGLRPERFKKEPLNTLVTVFNIQPEDEGDYVCTAHNDIGNNSHTMQIRVEAEPRFLTTRDQPHDTNVTEGSSLTFHCNAYAKPIATVVWLRNGRPLDLDNLPNKFRISKDKKSLTIENLCRDCTDLQGNGYSDLSIIQCNASNLHGYAFAAGYVNVLLKTRLVLTGGNISVNMSEEKSFEWECKATSDPSTPPLVRWYTETKDGDQLVVAKPPFLALLKNGTIRIHVVPNKTHGWKEVDGKYRCDADNGYSKESATVMINIYNYVPPEPKQAGFPWWIIILAVILFLVFILLVCICCCCLNRDKGATYDVDGKERMCGHDPEKELITDGFQDYQRPEGLPRKGSRCSLDSVGKMPSEDGSSLLEFVDDPGKFTEDGSFVGAYATNTADRSRGRRQ